MARKGRGWDAKPSDPSRAADQRRGPAQSIPDDEADPFGVEPDLSSTAPDPDDPFGLAAPAPGSRGKESEDLFGADPYAGGADPAAFTATSGSRSRGRQGGESDEPEKPPRRRPPGEAARAADLLGAEAAEFARTRKPATARRKQSGDPVRSSRDPAELGDSERPVRRSLPWSTASSPESGGPERGGPERGGPESGGPERRDAAQGEAAGEGEDSAGEESGGRWAKAGAGKEGRGRWAKAGARRGVSGGGRGTRAGREGGDTPENADPHELAREICLRQLATRPRTRKELALAMRKRGVAQEVADAVLDRYGEVGMIDDAAFARAWVSSRHHSKGLAGRALAQELRQRGVEQEVAQEALSELDSDTEAATALDLAMRKLRSTRGEPEAVFRRLVGMLARKGYSGGVAVRAVKEALATRDAELADLIDPDVYEE